MRTHSGTPASMPMWIAGISICLLAAAGLAAIARPIPATYAGISDSGEPSSRETVPSVTEEEAHAKNRETETALASAAKKRRNLVQCAECGVVVSMRRIERLGCISGQDTVCVKVGEDASGSVSGAAIATEPATARSYEITVRFRDGSRTILTGATPSSWRLGSHVIVIGRLHAPND